MKEEAEYVTESVSMGWIRWETSRRRNLNACGICGTICGISGDILRDTGH